VANKLSRFHHVSWHSDFTVPNFLANSLVLSSSTMVSINRPGSLLAVSSIFCSLFSLVASHEHHDEELPEGQVITFEPVDGILWAHIFIMTVTFGVLFPTGMVEPMKNALNRRSSDCPNHDGTSLLKPLQVVSLVPTP
jgi:hypothetical protein